MFEASTVPVTPKPSPSKEGSALRIMLPTSGRNATVAVRGGDLPPPGPPGGDSQGGKMLVTPATTQQVEHTRVALVLLALAIVLFWRVALRVLLVIAIVALGVGTLVLLQ